MRWTRRSQEDFSDEIRAHLLIETDRLMAEGMSREDAALAARRTFGNVMSTTERFYESRRLLWLDQLAQDLRAGARSLLRYPVVALVAVLSIGAGIGAFTAFLTVRNFVFENPPPLYVRPEQLSKVQVNRQDRPILPIGSNVPADLYATWRGMTGIAIAASRPPRGLSDIRMADRIEAVPVRPVTSDFFATLGVAPETGRTLSAPVAGQPEAVLSNRLWQQWFVGRNDAVGSTIWIDNQPHTVVGVMPHRFWFSEMSSPIWTLLEPGTLSARDELQVVVRRPDGMSGDALAARLQSSLVDYARQMPAGEGPLHLRVSDVKGTPIGDAMSFLLPYVFGVSVFLTLLIACANVAILMIAQWTTREAETAMRAALGATRWRIVRALVAESVVLASGAGALGLCVTFALRGILVSRASTELAFMNLSIDPALFLQSAGITIFTGVVAGIGPALFETRRLQVDPLRGIATSDRVRQRWSHALVVLEITVTLALLVVTSSMIDGYQRGQHAELGFNADSLMVAAVTREAGIQTSTLKETLERLPGVRAVAATTAVPLFGRGRTGRVSADPSATEAVAVEQIAIGSDFFAVLGVPLRAGRSFTNRDSSLTRTAIVNEALAQQIFGTRAPLGRQVWLGGASYDVVGVVADYSSSPIEYRGAPPKLFRPLPAEPQDVTAVQFLVRAMGNPVGLVQPVRRALRESSTGMVVTTTLTLRQMLNLQGKEMLAGTAPFFPLIIIGMLLMSSGIYGVLAFAIARRSRELAVRVAIGASRRDQLLLVTTHSLRLLGLGSALGVGVTFALSRVVRAAGGAGSFYDPPWPAFVLPVLIVLVVGAIATWIPTRRALRISPSILLRTN